VDIKVEEAANDKEDE
jgi:hypothetical protein